MKKIYSIIIIAFVLLFSTCTKDKEPSQLEIFIHNVETTDFSALIEGEYVYDNEIKDLYLLYGKDSLLIDGTTKKKVDLQEKRFSVVIDDLLSNTQYYYCIEYSSKYSNFKTKIYDFVTQEIEEPSLPDVPDNPSTPEEPDDSNDISSVTTSDVTDITSNSAICGGIIVSDDMTIITSCGVCWNTYSQPTINDSHTSDEIGNGIFISELTNLEANTKFYVRAYATTDKGVTYGEQKEFVTLKVIDVPTVTTTIISNVTETEAIGGGNVVSDGGAFVTEKGICWSTSPNPTIENDRTVDGFGLGSFVSYMQGLTHNTKYYVRAYATNEIGTAYGEQKEFSTLINIVAPEVTTNNITSITPNSATCGGNVISDGNAEVMAKGVCWSTTPNPTIYNDHTTDGSGLGSFVSYLSNLNQNTKYYVRAYATNKKETAYGEEKCFETKEIILPTVITYEVSNVTTRTATCSGNVVSDGNAPVTARGICWSTSSNPTIDDKYKTIGSNTGSFIADLENLLDNTTYYVRAFATNEKGTAYGEEKVFTTIEIVLPTVTTKDVTSITAGTAVCGGDVISDGNAMVTTKGVCWSINPNPTTEDNKMISGSGIGAYTLNISNLSDNTTYYIRAYATNLKGTSYGEEMIFKTLERTFENGYEYVDLGLPSGLKWATNNIGANEPEDYGNYYSWGEIETKDVYKFSSCETYGMGICEISGWAQYDAARANWGGDWRMPTKIEMQELIDECIWIWTTQNGVNGCKVEGPSGASIFLPAAGRGREESESSVDVVGKDGIYWSSTSPTNGSFYYYAYALNFFNNTPIDCNYPMSDYHRGNGFSVRPVIK